MNKLEFDKLSHKIVEMDVITWLINKKHKKGVKEFIYSNLDACHFKDEVMRDWFYYLKNSDDILTHCIQGEESVHYACTEMLYMKINWECTNLLQDAVMKVLEYDWMEKRECIRNAISNFSWSNEEVIALIKVFDECKGSKPKLKKQELLE